MTTTTESSSRRGLALLKENAVTVWRNRDVRRLQLAFVGSEIGSWAYAMAIMVWAYDVGGAALVGTWAGVRSLLGAVGAPIGGAIADRWSRRAYMLAVDAICAVLVVFTAAAIVLDLGMWAVLIPATVSSIVGVTFRPAQAGLLPRLVENPRQLTSANATAEIIDSTAQWVGPAIAGILLGLVGIVPVVLLQAVGFLWSLLLVSRVASDRKATPEESEAGDQHEDTDDEESFLKESVGGFRAILADRDLTALTGLLAVNGVLAGVLMVLLVLVAAEMVGDPNAVGMLSAVLGIATFVGGFVILMVAGRVRLGRLMVIGVLGWCIPLIVLGLVPGLLIVVLALVVIGLCDPLINVGFGTIPPRLVPDRLLSRVFAAIESMFIGAAALGAFITPVLVSWLGLEQAVIVLGLVGVVVTLVCSVRVPHLDKRLGEPRGLELLSRSPLFAPLSPGVREQLAHKLEPTAAEAGDVILTKGGVSDLLYLIESGEVEVSDDGLVLATLQADDVIGEIGLIRDVPRTATVTALTDTSLLMLGRDDFLDVVAGDDAVSSVAADLVAMRLCR
ncbi:MFS transporter [Ornithinimicrobium cryptoxanthini]|uniref:MFS transporter n=1 Tax=Ornithinimicrobium cryptoxanthini TaxID=2934161 RepID=A0ABY4YFR4_9MICO|nr:MFS transporter [Ornithinimicrobium cryptoxanthini]USQ75454.1 MFS transporter [Ornithinimicrobium cryptoxanthini]